MGVLRRHMLPLGSVLFLSGCMTYDPRALHRSGELVTAVISEERGGVSGQAGTVGAFRHKWVATERHVLRCGSFFFGDR